MTRPYRKPHAIALIACVVSCFLPLSAADLVSADLASAKLASEIEQLKQLLADQQRQINELRHALEQKDSAASAAPGTPLPSLGLVASAVPVLPPSWAGATSYVVPQAQPAAPAVNVNEL